MSEVFFSEKRGDLRLRYDSSRSETFGELSIRRPTSKREFFSLAAMMIRREILDMARQLRRQKSHAAHHHRKPISPQNLGEMRVFGRERTAIRRRYGADSTKRSIAWSLAVMRSLNWFIIRNDRPAGRQNARHLRPHRLSPLARRQTRNRREFGEIMQFFDHFYKKMFFFENFCPLGRFLSL